MTILVISNEERNGIMKIIKSLEKIGFLIRIFSETILGILTAIISGNM